MCTCLKYVNGGFYFGRNLDLEYHFKEKVIVTPRRFPIKFKHMDDLNEHFAIIGMATNFDSYPLYAEGMNERGLGAAGLYFPGNAVYEEFKDSESGKKHIAACEVIQYILARFEKALDVKNDFINNVIITNEVFSEGVPSAPLHWMVADKENCFVIEVSKRGMKVYDNKIGVLTNNPHFDYHLNNINNYRHLSPMNGENKFSGQYPLSEYGQGMGAIGLPGDYSPASRFIKIAFGLANSKSKTDEESNVSQFFHLLDSVAFPRGSVITKDGLDDITTYSCCISASTMRFYFKTYDNHQINVVDLRKENLDSKEIICYEFNDRENFNYLN